MPPRPGRPRNLVPGFDAVGAIGTVLDHHRRYLRRIDADVAEDPKVVLALLAAGRAILAHAEHVVKIAALVAGGEAAEDPAALLAAARAGLGDSTEEEESEPDDSAGGAG